MEMSKEEIRRVFFEEGADDAGFVEISRKSLSTDAPGLLRIFPDTKTIVSLVKRANRDALRSPSVSVADLEFAQAQSALSSASVRALGKLIGLGIRGIVIPPSFPMDMTRWPGKVWEVSHKTIAVEAGMGCMGINRVVIHPKFGNHIILGSLLLDAGLDKYDHPLEHSPCIECSLCVGVCPVGAISREKGLHFMSCAMHNYHELFGGFQDWIECVVSSKDVLSYRLKFRDSETAAKWQSLTYGHFYRCSYCMAVCPAGEETAGDFEADKKGYMEKYVRPLREKREPVYVIEGTRAEKAARKRDMKEIRYVKNTIRPASVETFLDGVPLLFNTEKAKGVELVLDFEFSGNEDKKASVKISGGEVEVTPGLSGKPDLFVRADSAAWIRMLNGEISPIKAMLSGKIRLKGNPRYLGKFKKCIL
jgi:ferredoxin